MYLPVDSSISGNLHFTSAVWLASPHARSSNLFSHYVSVNRSHPRWAQLKECLPPCFSSERIIFCLNLLCGFQARLFMSEVSFPSHLCIHSGCGTVPTLSLGTRLRVLMRDSILRSRWITNLNPCTSMGRLLRNGLPGWFTGYGGSSMLRHRPDNSLVLWFLPP